MEIALTLRVILMLTHIKVNITLEGYLGFIKKCLEGHVSCYLLLLNFI